jgi:succinate-acetate transporter protein
VVCPIRIHVLSIIRTYSSGFLVSVVNYIREMALGNTFGATTFTSFGAYWVTFAMSSTFENPDAINDAANATCQNETLTGLFMLVKSRMIKPPYRNNC